MKTGSDRRPCESSFEARRLRRPLFRPACSDSRSSTAVERRVGDEDRAGPVMNLAVRGRRSSPSPGGARSIRDIATSPRWPRLARPSLNASCAKNGRCRAERRRSGRRRAARICPTPGRVRPQVDAPSVGGAGQLGRRAAATGALPGRAARRLRRAGTRALARGEIRQRAHHDGDDVRGDGSS